MKQGINYLILLVIFFSGVASAQNYSFNEIPNWVNMIDVPDESSVSKYDITSGYYLKLVDYQLNVEEEKVFYREIRNIISYSGITEASQLLVTFDTSYQHLQVHHLFIWRKGKKIDRTNDLSLKVMNNETNLHQGVYTGAVSVYENLDDIRKDDLIDFAYTMVGNNPIFGEDDYLFIPLAAMNPIDLFTLRILYPLEKEFVYECVDCDTLMITDELVDNHREITIVYPNLEPIKFEENIPPWLTPFKYFVLSSYKSWKDVNRWAESVFSLQNKPELNDVYDEVLSGNETTDQKIGKLINYVQDDIRYMGIESGIGSIKPFSPEQVVKQRFGDCKDKSLLLVWLLKNIGIEKAYPALVNSVLQSKVDKYLISNQIFDHCIVTFEYNNDTFWVDPTIAMQGGDFKNLYTYNYGKALVVGKPADSLQEMTVKNVVGATYYTDEFTFKSFTEPGRLFIKSERSGFEADTRRLFMEYYSVNDVTEFLTNELKNEYPYVNKVSEVEIDDDMDANTFTMSYSYDVGGMWQDGDNTNPQVNGFWMFRFEPRTLYQYINKTVCEEREYEFALSYPQNVHYRVIFDFPIDMLMDDIFLTSDNEAFHFAEKLEQINSHSFQIDYSLTTKRNSIGSADFKEVCEKKNELVKQLPLVIYFPK